MLWFYFGYSSYFTLRDDNGWAYEKADAPSHAKQNSRMMQDKRVYRCASQKYSSLPLKERAGRVNSKEALWDGRPIETYLFGGGFR
jgi:hypothetical protein